MKPGILICLLISVMIINNHPAYGQPEVVVTGKDMLAVIWTSDNPEVAEKVALLYTHAAKTNGWFDEVVLVIWGPSTKLIAGNPALQKKIGEMLDDGVIVEACVVCAEEYGVVDDLIKLGYEVKSMGVPLTEYLKSDFKVLTF
jgi:hypothetical protein